MPAAKTHTVRKNFRFTEAEAARLSKHAAKAGVSESDYVRTLINDPSHVFITEASTLRDLYRELKRQGVNINQVAYSVNAGRAKHIDGDILDRLSLDNHAALLRLGELLDSLGKEKHAHY